MKSGREFFDEAYPRLNDAGYEINSDYTPRYNCLAFAAGDQTHWWSTVELGGYYWPNGVPRDATLEGIKTVFRTLGFESCADGEFEENKVKIALYVKAGDVEHVAVQGGGGKWLSKVGEAEDIEHTLPGLEGNVLGSVAAFMVRAGSP